MCYGMQRLSKESAAAFVDLLRQADPPITAQTSFSDIEAQCEADERWQALSEDKRYSCFIHDLTSNCKISLSFAFFL